LGAFVRNAQPPCAGSPGFHLLASSAALPLPTVAPTKPAGIAFHCDKSAGCGSAASAVIAPRPQTKTTTNGRRETCILSSLRSVAIRRIRLIRGLVQARG